MEKNYVEIQGRFSSDGMFVGGNYVPEVIDKLMNDVYSTPLSYTHLTLPTT
mgnify:CR=1 FL=1